MSENLANTTKISGNKTSTIITLFLIFAMTFSVVALPLANAHTPSWTIPTFAYIHVSPNPVGVGQQVTVVFWLDKIYDGALVTNNYRFHNYELTITAPDGSDETKTYADIADTTSSQYYLFTPTQVGTYTLTFEYPGQNINDYSHANDAFVNDSYTGSSAITTLTVQEEPVPAAIDSYPLPTEYWTRPIEAQNTYWYTIASNWLSFPSIVANYQPDGTAPNSAHIMWTKPIEEGGVVGGTNTGENGTTFYTGLSYETKFNPVIIMNGRMYYPLPKSNNGAAGFGAPADYNGYVCVDLRTGEQLFWQNTTMPNFGQLLDYDDPNQHGVIPNGYLWTVSGSTWSASDPLTGNWLFDIKNVPSGTLAYGPNGELLIYTLSPATKSLTVWNSTAAIARPGSMATYRPVSSIIDSATLGALPYSLNATESWLSAGSRIVRVIPGDVLLGLNGSLPSSGAALVYPSYSSTPYTMWALNLNPLEGPLGSLIWMKNYDPPSTNTTLILNFQSQPATVDQTARVFVIGERETFQWTGYSLDTGEKLWGPTTHDWDSFQYYHGISGGPNLPRGLAAYGNLYVGGYGGEIVAFDMKTGQELWTYNNTNSGLNTVYGHYPIFISSIADGKIYAHTSEHSPNSPPFKGALIRCINATTGDEIWTLPGWNTFTPYGANLVEPIYIADGYASYLNVYDMQVYTIGKGPSKITVEAPLSGVTQGSSVVLRGTVTDIASGTTQNEQKARFPNGVACVSDESQSEWMQYVYMQKPKPNNATGVQVTLSVIDSNDNYRIIGTTTTTDGFFTFNWTPDIPGQFTVYATFGGSESYWPSSAMTSFAVDSAPEPTAAPTPTPAPMTDAYVLSMGAAAVIAIVVIGLVIILMLRKR